MTAGRPEARRATDADAPLLVDILDRAFERDPFVSWIVGGRGPRARRRYADLVVRRLTLPHGECWVEREARGAALWTPPGRWELPLGEQLRMLPRVARVVGLSRMMLVARAAELIEEGRPQGPYYYLALLGTLPEARGLGVASAVLAPVLACADEDATPCLLETSVEGNVPFYRRFGFEVERTFDLPEGGPPVWSMRRDPR